MDFWGQAEPGSFETGGFPTFFGQGPDCVADLLGLFLVGASNEKSPRISGKSRKGQKGTKKDRKGRTNPDREAPLFEPPPFSALKFCTKSPGKNGFFKELRVTFAIFTPKLYQKHRVYTNLFEGSRELLPSSL